jgi:hypothetical protein
LWERQTILTDDWACSESGYVDDIHVWFAWEDDQVGQIDEISIAIMPDNSGAPGGGPGNVLWYGHIPLSMPTFTISPYGSGDQGWYDPYFLMRVEPNDHRSIYQLDLEGIDAFMQNYEDQRAFYQEAGTTYWLGIILESASGGSMGWVTSQQHFGGNAHNMYFLGGPTWRSMTDPVTGGALDLAFVVAPEPGTLVLLALAGWGLLGSRRR